MYVTVYVRVLCLPLFFGCFTGTVQLFQLVIRLMRTHSSRSVGIHVSVWCIHVSVWCMMYDYDYDRIYFFLNINFFKNRCIYLGI